MLCSYYHYFQNLKKIFFWLWCMYVSFSVYIYVCVSMYKYGHTYRCGHIYMEVIN